MNLYTNASRYMRLKKANTYFPQLFSLPKPWLSQLRRCLLACLPSASSSPRSWLILKIPELYHVHMVIYVRMGNPNFTTETRPFQATSVEMTNSTWWVQETNVSRVTNFLKKIVPSIASGRIQQHHLVQTPGYT